mmetsp:Transcript_25975/g.38383  ORF Transcript_25975/g.38383 Transcript_25975/m.38383 type:complete len:266 (+) Transcript_25975:120-917(+)|eukprot:CAMPEP_0194212854 /NCGR_PEP_ID=MMETSP0156-20130528/12988_1 /TAXON_ID=33649 /ORGANISM="Thalassionema nitzschioides, Strain L26-B" /LENGTH=265 /DNA_ID=CAMNT_0038940745 /DNA_START=20 /DNA_END=817 /DNA_ORIENTATION=+
MSNSLCGSIIQSRRGLLAFIWSLVTLLTMIAFITALFFTITAKNMDQYYDDQDDAQENREGDDQDGDPEIAVTSRAMAFAALWTAVLACLMSVFGTVILGFQSPTGQYYTCCAGLVHRTTPLGLGSFIGALLMFANLTLVCSVLFGEFEIRDNIREEDNGEDGGNDYAQQRAVERSSMAFSIMCMFLTVLYAGFAATVYAFSHSVLKENQEDEEDFYRASQQQQQPYHGGGYIIDNRFDVHPSSKPGFAKPGFVGTQGSSDSGLT